MSVVTLFGFLIGGKLLRCSAHSVRPVTPTEKLHYELNKREDVTKWKTLTDIIPEREFTDISDEIPTRDQLEEPLLPPLPDGTTVVPGQRVYGKKSVPPEDWRQIHRSTPLGLRGQSSSTYGPGLDRAPGFFGSELTSTSEFWPFFVIEACCLSSATRCCN